MAGRIEREHGLGLQRVDLLILWLRPQGMHQFVVECKIRWDSLERIVAEGLEQTAGYTGNYAADSCHLVIFDRSERPWWGKVFGRMETVSGTLIEAWGM